LATKPSSTKNQAERTGAECGVAPAPALRVFPEVHVDMWDRVDPVGADVSRGIAEAARNEAERAMFCAACPGVC
jgi:hypothetical protein